MFARLPADFSVRVSPLSLSTESRTPREAQSCWPSCVFFAADYVALSALDFVKYIIKFVGLFGGCCGYSPSSTSWV